MTGSAVGPGSLVRVAVPVPLLPSLSYRVPSGQDLPPLGARVRVPLGNRVVVGCVIDVGGGCEVAEEDFDDGTIKEVIEYVDNASFLPASVIKLALWIADYYACGPGDAVAAAMPPYAWGRKGLTSACATTFKTERVVWLTDEGRRIATGDVSQPPGRRQQAALAALADSTAGIAARLLSDLGISADTIRRLTDRGLTRIEVRQVERDPFQQGSDDVVATRSIDIGPTLTPDQQTAFVKLSAMALTERFCVALLHGVTGSGKTELYLRLAKSVCERGRRVLVLVPEIALAPAIARIFRTVFGERVAIQHSGLSDGERHDQWHQIRRGEVDIVVGTRSAVFAPVENLGLIIVDEEHDGSYKQEESPRYHGRDAAIVRGQQTEALVVLGSATPSMESYNNAMRGRYQRVVLPQRVFERPLPTVRIVDMRAELATEGADTVLSAQLLEGLTDRLEKGEQSLVLLNRRGYAASVLCRQCGQTLECPNCSVTLTFHRTVGRVRCHYCSYSQTRPKVCPTCAGPYLERVGFGTERIEAEISRTFPKANVVRLDRDSARRRGAAASILARFARQDINVLVGTQMIAKGHDFQAVTLVGVISADIGLGLADFRAAERTFQLLTQVTGRAGRGDTPGEAVIQTFYPEHYSIDLACRQSYRPFFEAEMKYRSSMRYPPVVAMINAVVRAPRIGDAMSGANELARELRAVKGEFEVLGPAPAPISRLRGEYRAQVFMKGKHRPAMREALQEVLGRHPHLKRRVTVDVDPLTML